VTNLSREAVTNRGAGTAIVVANGMVIAADEIAGYRTMILELTNTDASARIATILAGDPPGRASGGAASHSSRGNLALSVPATTGDILVVIDVGRHIRADGDIYIDFAASFTGVARLYVPPRGI